MTINNNNPISTNVTLEKVEDNLYWFNYYMSKIPSTMLY